MIAEFGIEVKKKACLDRANTLTKGTDFAVDTFQIYFHLLRPSLSKSLSDLADHALLVEDVGAEHEGVLLTEQAVNSLPHHVFKPQMSEEANALCCRPIWFRAPPPPRTTVTAKMACPFLSLLVFLFSVYR